MKSLSPFLTKIRKAIQNVENGVVWGSYVSLKDTGNSIIRYITYEFLVAFHSDYLAVFAYVARSVCLCVCVGIAEFARLEFAGLENDRRSRRGGICRTGK